MNINTIKVLMAGLGFAWSNPFSHMPPMAINHAVDFTFRHADEPTTRKIIARMALSQHRRPRLGKNKRRVLARAKARG